jgi:hypothetical protein
MTNQERCLIVAETGISLTTVIKWDKGIPVHPQIDAKIRQVAVDCGLLEKRVVKG